MITPRVCNRIGRFYSLLLAATAASALLVACGTPETEAPALTGRADTYSMAAGTILRRGAPGVLANDQVTGGGIQARLAAKPAFGTISVESDGSFVYEPGWRFTGNDAFSYQLVDGEKVSAPIRVRISPPNVIVILADDLGRGDIGIYDRQSAADTPNLDALANAGMTFGNAHSPAAVCSPSRYSLLTGNYPYRGRIATGVWDSYEPATMIVPGQTTLGDLFSEAGYITAFIGKLHNGGAFYNRSGKGYTRDHAEMDFTRRFDRGPTQFGFDYSFILPDGTSGPPYAWFENDQLVRFDSGAGKYQPFVSNDDAAKHLVYASPGWGKPFNGGAIGVPGWAMDNFDARQIGGIITRKALGFLEQAIDRNQSAYPSKPFFLFFAPPQIHPPYSPPEFFDARHANDIEPSATGTPVAGSSPNPRIDMIRETDLMLGALVDFLAERNELENTLIIFSSDNGPVTWPIVEGRYPPGTDSGVQLRGLKGEIHEGGHRVPLLARWGDGSAERSYIPPGTNSRYLLGLNDLAATFYALLGKQRPYGQANDSKNFLPVLLGESSADTQLRDHLIVQGSPPSVPDANLIDRAFYKYDSNGDLWKLTVISGSTDPLANLRWGELYNLSKDPGESTNRLSDAGQQELLAAMQAEYLDLISQPQTIISWK